MQPWRISAGLTAALVGSGLVLAGPHLEYLAPFWPLILTDHGIPIVLHSALALDSRRGRHLRRRTRRRTRRPGPPRRSRRALRPAR